MRILKKALPLWSAFFLAFFLSCTAYVRASCPSGFQAAAVDVANVYDGDTVRLKDGRRIRLIGINAPETEKENKPAEYLANESAQRLRELLKGADVSLLIGKQPQDRYKRWLGHLFVDGRLASEYLLSEGLAFHIAIPPNLKFLECLQQAERRAVDTGLWAEKSDLYKSVFALNSRESGFRVVTGKVSKIRKIRNGYIVEVGRRLAVKVPSNFFGLLGITDSNRLLGGKVRVRGWIRPKAENAPAHFMPWFLSVRHSSQFEML
ncbi:MAG: thermonuclease family protein [Neptuniibacter sp.]